MLQHRPWNSPESPTNIDFQNYMELKPTLVKQIEIFITQKYNKLVL